MSYTDLTIKTIYGRSYNECNHPDCSRVIIAVDTNTDQVVNHGEMAHIRARKQGEERWDGDYPKEKLNEAENLILLCANHHKIIDQKGAAKHYTVDLLNEWKAKHYEAKEVIHDREWVYGSSTIAFNLEDVQHTLHYWRDSKDNIRFFTDDQLAQANAAKEVQYIFSQFSEILRRIDTHDPTPHNPSHVTQNDGMMQILARESQRIRKGQFNAPGTEFDSLMHRLYNSLKACPDITMAELSLVNTTGKLPTTTILVGGEATSERVVEAMQQAGSSREK